MFLSRQYDGVTIDDIEAASGMTRGAIFYYAETKFDLYKQVMQHFMFDVPDLDESIISNKDISLYDFMQGYIAGIEKSMKKIGEIVDDTSSNNNPCRAYVSTLLNLCLDFPEMKDRYMLNIHKDIGRWVNAVNAAKIRKEIRSDIDTQMVARDFVSIFYGVSVIDGISFGLNMSQLKEQMLALYNLLKIEQPEPEPEPEPEKEEEEGETEVQAEGEAEETVEEQAEEEKTEEATEEKTEDK